MVKTPLPPRPAAPTSSAIRDLLALTERPDVTSLAGGLPHPAAVPAEAIAAASAAVLATDADAALQYGPTEGHGPLRAWIARRTATAPDEVLVTAGSQQALDLVVRTLVPPGSTVALGDPAYVGALQVVAGASARPAPIPVDADGLRVDVLAERLAAGLRPALVYVVAATDNPTGTSLSAERRRQLVALADRHGFWIVDDDAYGELRWDGAAPAPLRHGSDRVLTLGSTSKVLSPGLRVGWVTGPAEVIRDLAIAKQAADLQTGSLTQRIVARVVADEPAFAAHLDRLRARYRTLFIAEGLTQYLSPAAVTALFDRLSAAAPGSQLIFSYVRQDFIDGENRYGAESLYRRFRERAQVWQTGFVPEQLGDVLHEHGWRLSEQAGPGYYRDTYIRPTGRDLTASQIEWTAVAERT